MANRTRLGTRHTTLHKTHHKSSTGARLTVIEESVASLHKNFTSLQESMASMEESADSLQKSMVSLEKSMASLKETLAHRSHQIQQNSDNVQLLIKRFDLFEKTIDSFISSYIAKSSSANHHAGGTGGAKMSVHVYQFGRAQMSNSDKKAKLIWANSVTELYIKICVQEVRLGNRPTSHLNKQGWNNLKENLKKHSNKDFDRKQLKNKWYNLKKEWQLWRRLIGKDTGLGWNPIKKTIEADDDWWNAKLKEVPTTAKFREKGLLFAEELDIIFGEIVATGEHAWAPSSGLLSSDSIKKKKVFPLI